MRYLPDPLLQQHKYTVIGICGACLGNPNAVELFSVIAALVARDDFFVMQRRPVRANEIAIGRNASRAMPVGRSRRNWRGRLQDRWREIEAV